MPGGSLGAIADDPTHWGSSTSDVEMDFGMIFFAGSGANSRTDQLVFALCKLEGCKTTALGKAKWEVPFGRVREEDFDVLHKIEKSGFPYPKLEMVGLADGAGGPSQTRMRSDREYLESDYPEMEYFTRCQRRRFLI